MALFTANNHDEQPRPTKPFPVWILMLVASLVIIYQPMLLQAFGVSSDTLALDDFTQACVGWLQVMFVYYSNCLCCVAGAATWFIKSWALIIRRSGLLRVLFAMVLLYVWSGLFILPLIVPYSLFMPLLRQNLKDSVMQAVSLESLISWDDYFDVKHAFDEYIDPHSSVRHFAQTRRYKLHVDEDATFVCNFDFPVNVSRQTIKVKTEWQFLINNDTYTLNPNPNVRHHFKGRMVSGPPIEGDPVDKRRYRVNSMLTIIRYPQNLFGVVACRATITVSPKRKSKVNTAHKVR
jgi:hypothetical protein